MNVIGFDGGPFPREHKGDVLLVGVVCSGTRVDGILSSKVRRDGANATRAMVEVVTRRRPDMAAVKQALFSGAPGARPRVAGAARKWKLIEDAGTMELLGESRRALRRDGTTKLPSGRKTPASGLFIQRVGLSLDQARKLVADTTLHGNIPEPLRLAHLIAGGITTGSSRGRA